VTTQKPKQRLMQTTNVCETKPNETKDWFRSPYMPSGHKMGWAYSTAPGACTRQAKLYSCHRNKLKMKIELNLNRTRTHILGRTEPN